MIHLRVDEADARTHALNKSAASALFLVSASPSIKPVDPKRRVTSIRLNHPRMTAMSLAQRLSSIPVGEPEFVTKSNTLLQSMTLMAENRWMYVSLFSKQNCGEQDSGKHAHDPFQVSQS